MSTKVIVNANIITMSENNSKAQAIGIMGDKIVKVGCNNDVIEALSKFSKPEIIDAQGYTILPGFIDNHVHFLQTGHSIISLNLSQCSSWEQILELVAKEAEVTPHNYLIRGYNYEDHFFLPPNVPNRWDLDKVAPNHLVFLNKVDFHSAIINSNTLKELKLPENISGINKDDNGTPTGLLSAEACIKAKKTINLLIPEEENILSLYEASKLALSSGITTVVAMEGDMDHGQEEVKLVKKFRETSRIRIEIFYQTIDITKVLNLGLKRIGGCILLDGSIGSSTAAISDPYKDNENNSKGILYFKQEEINSFILNAHKAGLQVAMHAIGDRAIEQILKAYENAFCIVGESLKHKRHRIEHFELPTTDHIDRVKKMGLMLSMQPAFEFYWGGPNKMYDIRLGSERIKRSNPLKEIIDKDIVIAGGSDAAVTSMNPFIGIYAAVNHPSKKQAVSVYEALKMYTINGAIALGLENERGTIEEGKMADLIILKDDPLKIKKDKLIDIRVEQTMVGGEILYNKNTGIRTA